MCTCSTPQTHEHRFNPSHILQVCISTPLLAQSQGVLSILLRPSGRARGISDATGRIFGDVADALGCITQSSSRALEGVAEDVAEAAHCSYFVRNGVVCT